MANLMDEPVVLGPQTVLPGLSQENNTHTKLPEVMQKHMDTAKKEESQAMADRNKPLELLDLPIDILQTILRHVPQTNDLVALALTHSSLHDLVIPHIYSRFDIVWPEASVHVETRIGVDALTYGLATLVMAPDVFGESPHQPRQSQIRRSSASTFDRPHKTKRGNNFARYTKKFSLGNGPSDWVQEYLITKEAGKMVGTLVALAVGRMRNLEAFIWDMPTGVLRDVWLALASLGNRDDGQPCRLEKVWVRWHDNSESLPSPSPPPPGIAPVPQPSNLPSILASTANALFQIPAYPRVVFPTFSILPPLKSLNVLDIDELSYAEEIGVLIERSLPVLRELRIGVASHARVEMWARPQEDRTPIPPSQMPANATVPRPGGILGILVSQFCDHFQMPKAGCAENLSGPMLAKAGFGVEETQIIDEDETTVTATSIVRKTPVVDEGVSQVDHLGQLLADQSLADEAFEHDPLTLSLPKRGQHDRANQHHSRALSDVAKEPALTERSRRLQLDVLELERVYISTNVLASAVDWSRLTTLTLLGCHNHEHLWKELRKQFTPVSRLRIPSSSTRSVSTSLAGLFSASSRNSTPMTHQHSSDEYSLKIRRLHTDSVSPALIAFIKDTLAPDTLEWLFLQENNSYKSTVSMDMIYKGAIKRHRGSLKKLLIDSEVRKDEGSVPGSWKRLIASRELLIAITSGKMSLRELSLSIDYKDWHFFLQRLPGASTLRSLHIAHIVEHVHGTVDSREAALQVLDIISLRPDLELCYLGIQKQCFEVLEYSAPRRSSSPGGESGSAIQSGLDSDDNESTGPMTVHDDSDLDLGSSAGEETEDEGHDVQAKLSFRLREILFYDDKVSIFRAKHARL